MLLGVLVVVCGACLVGYWWLGKTATPGQRAMEEHVRAFRFSFVRSMAGKFKSSDPDWWTREPGGHDPVPEPEAHKEPWRH